MPTTLTLTAHGQPAQVLTVPTSWQDVSLHQFVTLYAPEPGDARTAAEVLLSLPAGGLGQLAAQDVPYLASLLDFASDPGPVLELLPTVGLPDPGSLPWGCLVLVQQHLAGLEGRGELAALPFVLAVYRTQLRDGSTDRHEQVLAHLLAAPCTETVPDGLYFLGRCRPWLNGTSPTKPTTTSQPTKRKRRIPTPRWLSALARRWRSMHLPRAT